jgi:hypothetical protein
MKNVPTGHGHQRRTEPKPGIAILSSSSLLHKRVLSGGIFGEYAGTATISTILILRTITITMTTTTRVLFAIAAMAAICSPLLLLRNPPPALAVVPPVKAPSASSQPQPRAATPHTRPPSPPTTVPSLGHTVVEDEKLILAEFVKLGGSIREEYVDNDINNVIRDSFGNDRAAFERDIAQKGQTVEQFRKLRRDKMIIAVIKARATKGITDRAEKERAIEKWLTELRMKSISPAPGKTRKAE